MSIIKSPSWKKEAQVSQTAPGRRLYSSDLNHLTTDSVSSAYELDLSLVNDFDRAWREMHIKTDVFCSGSIILPDKAGRQINVGGWSLQSTFGVRLFTPDGSPGVPSHNDWEENVAELTLQASSSYESALMIR